MVGSGLRIVLLLFGGQLAGCANAGPVAVLAEGASVAVFGRGIVDIGVSAISGRDCSIVRLDRGLTYCATTQPSAPERYCTRTLATADCWPAAGVLGMRPGIGDTPPPSAAQRAYQMARWPKALTFE